MFLLELFQQIVDLLGLRDEVGFPDMVLPFEVLLLVCVLEEVFDVEDTLYVVDGLFVDRQTGVFRLADDA